MTKHSHAQQQKRHLRHNRQSPPPPTTAKLGSSLSTSSFDEDQMATARKLVDQMVASSRVAIFSKSYCPYCMSAKRTIKGLNLPAGVTTLELDHEKDGAAIQAYLLDKTGQRTVPNIFIGGVHLGGNDDLGSAQRSGKLKQLLEQSEPQA
ncbi:glutaredoxin [Acaromyces ingoldii]|uniref:glutathione peroxidase n=1 Tax=Acaromyces ingoldii TaxID=215250 RepID=A0A316YV43_9BASI|nr:glutaredoxin [Acaromyces ingoldii]PWN93287.1 glutaredoxin [Acaromyces ingoldii]